MAAAPPGPKNQKPKKYFWTCHICKVNATGPAVQANHICGKLHAEMSKIYWQCQQCQAPVRMQMTTARCQGCGAAKDKKKEENEEDAEHDEEEKKEVLSPTPPKHQHKADPETEHEEEEKKEHEEEEEPLSPKSPEPQHERKWKTKEAIKETKAAIRRMEERIHRLKGLQKRVRAGLEQMIEQQDREAAERD